MDMGIVKKLKSLYCTKLVNYILEAIHENLLTSRSTATEIVQGSIFYKHYSFFANTLQRANTNTIQKCVTHCGSEHSDLVAPNKADSENDHHIGDAHHKLQRQ
jgi:hypothetical protein